MDRLRLPAVALVTTTLGWVLGGLASCARASPEVTSAPTIPVATPPTATPETPQGATPRRPPLFPADVVATSTPAQLRARVLRVQLSLARFGYLTRPFDGIGDARTVAAIEAYRRDIGMGDGEALIDRFVEPHFNSDRYRWAKPVKLPPWRVWVSVSQGIATARGTWKADIEGPVRFEDATYIRCDRGVGVCFEAIASLFPGHQSLRAEGVFYEIERFDDERIEAVRRRPCGAETLSISPQSKSVRRIRRRTVEAEACRSRPPQEGFVLVDGRERAREMAALQLAELEEYLAAQAAASTLSAAAPPGP